MTGFSITRAQAAKQGVVLNFPHDAAYIFLFWKQAEPLTYVYPAIIFG